MAVKALHHRRTGLLIRTHQLTPVFRVKLPGEPGGVHQVAEQHGQLAPFGIGRWRSYWGFGLDGIFSLGGRRWSGQPRRGDWLKDRWRFAWPHQTLACLINHLRVSVEHGLFEVCEVVVIEGKLPLEGAIRYPPLALEHGDRLLQDLLERHGVSSTSVSVPRCTSLAAYCIRIPAEAPSPDRCCRTTRKD